LLHDNLPRRPGIRARLRDRKKYFILRKAAWSRLDALLAPERVGR
jgi:hypothetical protein